MAKATTAQRVIIMGAAGRDFHDFNAYWKRRDDVQVVCFTAAQIPGIEGRIYPPELAGPRYPRGIPIEDEHRLEALIRDHGADLVAFAYSDVPHEHVMHCASRASSAGASFVLLAAGATMLASRRPVIAVCAVRTGSGKSQTSRRIVRILADLGRRVAVVRHPMPYGDLRRQVCQRFATLADLEREGCTIEEREEYEEHIRRGSIVFAGVDYERILRAAEAEADVILWDGGNNDTPFFRPDLHVVVADPHRAGHEMRYHPGETNLRMGDLFIVNKVDTAPPKGVEEVERTIRSVNPRARIIRARSPITLDDPGAVRGKRVLVVEDGPTLTHGEMKFGAGHVAAKRGGAAMIVDPRPYAAGSIRDVYAKYPHVTDVLPAMGYGAAQMKELAATIEAAPCDVVVIGTPIDLGRLLAVTKPTARARYELDEEDPTALRDAIAGAIHAPAGAAPAAS
jgi:predicted GTPase